MILCAKREMSESHHWWEIKNSFMWMFFKATSISHCQIKVHSHFTSISVIPAIWTSGFFPASFRQSEISYLQRDYKECLQFRRCLGIVILFDGLTLSSLSNNFMNLSYPGYFWLILPIVTHHITTELPLVLVPGMSAACHSAKSKMTCKITCDLCSY